MAATRPRKLQNEATPGSRPGLEPQSLLRSSISRCSQSISKAMIPDTLSTPAP